MKRIFRLLALTVTFVCLFSGAVMADQVNAVHTTTFVYHANGGVGEEYSDVVRSTAKSYKFQANQFSMTDYTFVSWNTKEDGTGKTYKPGTNGIKLVNKTKDRTVDLYAQWHINTLTVSFKGNGASNKMSAQKIELRAEEANIKANTFKRSGYIFDHWNTAATDDGTTYENGADLSAITDNLETSRTMVLYAQWRLKQPTISSVVPYDAYSIVAKYPVNSKASGFEIQVSKSPDFDSVDATVLAKSSSKSAKISVDSEDTVYYVRMRNYRQNKTSGVRIYSEYSEVKMVTTPVRPTAFNVSDYYAIETDVNLTGTGTGYHAKLLMQTSTAAVSYGLQYDQGAVAPYTGKTALLIENIASNSAGGQKYSRPGGITVDRGKTYHLMMTMNRNGKGSVYLNYKKVGTFTNTKLANKNVTLAIEGACRKNGDSINATFSNIRLKQGTLKSEGETFWCKWIDTTRNSGYSKSSNSRNSATLYDDTEFYLKGSISIPANKDWDSAGYFDHVSGVIQFYPR